MIDYFRKYGMNILFILLLFVMVRNPLFPMLITKNLVYGFFLIAAIMVFFHLLVFPKAFSLKSFRILYIIFFTYLVYYILFDHSYEGTMYIIVKAITFAIIMICTYYYGDAYMESFPNTIVKAGLFILFFGLLFDPNIIHFRYDGILNNANTLGFLSTLILGIFILREDYTPKNLALMGFLIILILATGSRGAILGTFLALILKNPSMKNIILMIFLMILFLIFNEIASSFGIVTGLNRIEETGASFTGRNITNAYGFKTLMLSPWTGFGLDKYAYISAKVIPIQLKYILVPNPHNSYLGMFIQLGIPLALLVFFTMAYYIFKTLLNQPKHRIMLFLVLFSAVSGLYESHLFSLFAFEGIVFWISIVLYLSYLYKQKALYNEI